MVPLDQKMSVLALGRADLEKEQLGFHYGDVTAELSKLWNFPQPIIDALRDTPMPLAAKEFSDAAGWVHLGAWRARVEVLSMSDDEQIASYPYEVSKRLGLSPSWVPALAAAHSDDGAALMPPLKNLTEGLEAMLD
jgi:hypothetical protein